MSTANANRGVVTSITVTISYPDDSTKQTTIENPADKLKALIFDEEFAVAMADAELIAPEAVGEWTAPDKWQERHTFLVHGTGIEGAAAPIQASSKSGDGTCAICMCQFCDNPVILK